jgi:phosphoglucosamine mutase
VRFGTDGIRGRAGDELTDSVAAAVGRAVVRELGARRVLVARDTRESGPGLEAALVAAVVAEGAVAESLGVAPTPAVAHAAREAHAPGVSITASHNPWTDNGLKVFATGGTKLDDGAQARLEAAIARSLAAPVATAPAATAESGEARVESWRRSLVAGVRADALARLHVVVDAAHGACSAHATPVLGALGATVTTVHAAPDGRNINAECGATHPRAVARATREAGADLGVAFDGDGDRLIAVDHLGEVVDGDHLIAIAARRMHERGELRGGAVAVTVMTNLGFHRAMRESGIGVVVTPVGDRAVLAALEERDLALGGEQSGHLVYRDRATTGDGILAAVQLALTVAERGPLHDLARAAMSSMPQVLVNVRVPDDGPAALVGLVAAIEPEVEAARRLLGEDGRVLVRASGTEPLVRVMVEAASDALARRVADELAASVARAAGAATHEG